MAETAAFEAPFLALAALLAALVCGVALALSSAPVAAFVASTADRIVTSIDRKHSGLSGREATSSIDETNVAAGRLADQDTRCVRIDVALLEAPPAPQAPAPPAPPAPSTTQAPASAIDTPPTHSATDLERDIRHLERQIKALEAENHALDDSIKRCTERDNIYSATIEEIGSLDDSIEYNDGFVPWLKQRLDELKRDNAELFKCLMLAQIGYADDSDSEVAVDDTPTAHLDDDDDDDDDDDNVKLNIDLDGWYFALPDAEAIKMAEERCDSVPSHWIGSVEPLHEDDLDASDAEWDAEIGAQCDELERCRVGA